MKHALLISKFEMHTASLGNVINGAEHVLYMRMQSAFTVYTDDHSSSSVSHNRSALARSHSAEFSKSMSASSKVH